ncbi:MAG TPA: M23 family metallopeptidase, partial [Candidatus Eisenbacteria bacterium]|nr:M23 family metallopeptidase [Candidatus Eisenbacteria bacterium]
LAAALGRSALGALGSGFRERVAGAAFSNLKLTLALLLTGLGFLVGMVALPVLLVVFAMSAGVSHGLRLDVPAAAVPPGPPLAPGELACPVPGAYVTQPFGPSELPGEPAMFGYGHFHTGVDLGAAQGTPIHAAEAGQVLQAAGQANSLGLLVGYGNLIRIQATSGRVDYYGHMVEFAVQRGAVVAPSQVIGYVGTTGYSTGPHLHFEIRAGGVPVDPAPFMRPC